MTVTYDTAGTHYTANKNRSWNELDNMRVNAGILNILRADNFPFRFHYEPNINIAGDTATFVAKQPNRRIQYRDDIDYRAFKTSVTLKQDLESVEFGCYGDVYSRDFGKMAISNSVQLEEFIDLHQQNAMAELNNDILRKYKEDIHTDGNFNKDNSIIENDATVYQSGTVNNKDNAEQLWDSIYTQATRMCRRSNKYNVGVWDKNESKNKSVYTAVSSFKDLILLYTPKVNAMIKSKMYGSYAHPEEVRLTPIFGGIGIMDFSDHAFSTDKFDPTTGANTGYGEWYNSRDQIVMLSKDSYKICDSVNPPLYVDNTRLGLSLKTYFFKWFFAFVGFIKFVNAVKWRSAEK